MKTVIFTAFLILSTQAFALDYEYLCKGAFDPETGNTDMFLLKTNKIKKTASISGTKKIDLIFSSEHDTTVEFQKKTRKSSEKFILDKNLFSGHNGSIFSGNEEENFFGKFADCIRN